MIEVVQRHARAHILSAFKPSTAASRPASVWSIRSNLALLAIACILPGALVSTYLIVSDYWQQNARVVNEAIATARAAAASLDRDLASIESGLQVLATSAALDANDMATFYQQAKEALPFQSINNYVLMDPSGAQHINTLQTFGTPLPAQATSPQLQSIFQTGETVLTDLFIGAVTGKPILALGVPVKRHGKIVYNLVAGLFPERMDAVLRAQKLPPDWIAGVLDSRGTLVARTHEASRFVGRSAVPKLVQMAATQQEGVLETVSLEGVSMITAFSRSNTSGWSVAVGVPKTSLNAGLKESLVTLLAVNTVLSAAALWVAWRLALAKVVHPADRLLERMDSLSKGQDPGPPSTKQTSREFGALERGLADMGERLRQHEEDQRAKVAAEAANRTKTNFLSRMSHELRTPLNAVLGFAQVLKMNTADPLSPRQLTMVKHIESSGLHLLDMISDVLDVSKIDSDEIDVVIEDVDVLTLTLDCQQMLTGQALEAGVQLEVVIQDGINLVRADRTRLKQVLLNLLSNAVKYNRRGGSVSLTQQLAEGQVTFRVRDNGLGMSEHQVKHLFEPFNRLGRENSATLGTGIGLVICKRLLDLMGATLNVQTIENEGSEFSFSLPVGGRPSSLESNSSRPQP